MMKNTLVIGSSVTDVIIRIHQMPKTAGDENILSQELSIGGCAFNVSQILKYFDVPYTLFSPIGTGIYGDFVKNYFLQENIPIHIETKQKNGCCYCIVDDQGERTFLCGHGAEYIFEEQWFHQLNPSSFQQVYICGLEIEEKTGNIIIDFLEQYPHLQIYFAPGPRIHFIDQIKLERIFALHPIVHLNQQELFAYTHLNHLERSLKIMYQKTKNLIIVTRGEDGCVLFDGNNISMYPCIPTHIVDTIGAGDSHLGTIIACQALCNDWNTTLQKANQIAAKVVSQRGSHL